MIVRFLILLLIITDQNVIEAANNSSSNETVNIKPKFSKSLSSKGLKMEKGSHRHVVLIVQTTHAGGDKDPLEMYLASGNIINTKWVLTLALPLKDKSASDLAIAPGPEVDANSTAYITKIFIEQKVDHPNPKPEYSISLLKTKVELTFNDNIGDVFYGMIRKVKSFLHCELVTWYLDTTQKKWIKTRMFVDPVGKSPSCQPSDPREFCIKVLLNSPKKMNPCAYSANLGTSLMCDIQLEGLFIGEGKTGCNNAESNSANKAFLLWRDPNVLNVFVVNNTQKLSDEEQAYFFDPYADYNFSDMSFLPSDKDENLSPLSNMLWKKRKKCSSGNSWKVQCYLLLMSFVIIY